MNDKEVIYSPEARMSDVLVLREYHSLVARLCTLYGDDLTVAGLLNISEKEFLGRRGIGKLYVDRLKKLQRLLSEHVCIGSSKQTLSCTPNADIRNIPAKYASLFEKLKECFPNLNTYADLCSISPSDFAKFFGVGKRKVESLIQWQSQILSGVQVDQFDESMIKQLDGYKLSSFFLSDAEQKLLTKHVRRGFSYEDLTPAYIMTLNAEDVISMEGYGKKSAKALQSLQFKIIEGLDLQSSQGILIPLRFGESLSLNELSPLIAEDLARFFDTLSGEEAAIWSSRLGYLTEQLTLQELGDQFGVTRERIRQRAEKMNESLLRGIRVCPDVLKKKILSVKRTELLQSLGDLRNEFCSDSALLKMLAIMANISSQELISQLNPSVRRDAFDQFLLANPRPLYRGQALDVLQDELGIMEDEAEVYLDKMEANDLILCRDSEIQPLRLGKEVAICHLLAGYPDGLKWQDVAREVNASGICRTRISEERPDPVLNASKYIYLCGHSKYRHVRFLKLTKDDVDYWLKDIRRVLIASSHESISLLAEYYSFIGSPKHEYYTVRHIVRSYGSKRGLYFIGKSQADSVSLFADANSTNQKDAILRILQSHPPMLLAEIAELIKSKSEEHALFYLNDLTSDGEVILLEDGTYSTPEIAFEGLDVARYLDALETILEEDSRVHHFVTLSSAINRILREDQSPRFYKSFANGYAKERGYFVRGFLISLKPVAWTSLTALAKGAPELQTEDLINWMRQRVCTSREIILRGIYNAGIYRDSQSLSDSAGGLASDVMEELFSL